MSTVIPKALRDVSLPDAIKRILSTAKRNHISMHLVGGCVRDYLRGVEPHDFDMTTSARPEQIKEIFRDCPVIDTGIRHGTVTLVTEIGNVEVTTWRHDGSYRDNRHPQTVSFLTSLPEDLRRRDFTVNAMAWDGEEEFLDLFGGITDLENKTMRCVGDPERRFTEDALRILRALRFSSILNFRIEPQTAHALHTCVPLLSSLSAQRIVAELGGILTGSNIEAVLTAYADVFAPLFPTLEISSQQNSEAAKTGHCLAALPSVFPVRFAAFLYGMAPKRLSVRDICRQLSLDNRTTAAVSQLYEGMFAPLSTDENEICKRISTTDFETVKEIAVLQAAFGLVCEEQKEAIANTIRTIEESGRCCFSEDLAINGTDLIALGVPRGKQIGVILGMLFEAVLSGDLPNQPQALLTQAKKYLAMHCFPADNVL